MKENFDEAIAFVFAHEGYLSTDKWGGDTMFGIASKYWPKEYVEIKNLAPDNQLIYAEDFYHKNFWDYLNCDALSYPLDVVSFDSAVNPGQNWAKMAVKECGGDWQALLDLREKYYRGRVTVHPEKKKYLKGWLNRVNDLRKKYGEV